jgi:RNase P subunit RPR2
MPLTICETLGWYLVVTCKECGARQPIHRDLSDGQSVLLRRYTWECIECDDIAVYQPSEIERYQHIVGLQKPSRN